jgi:DNA-directed RNA polymerase delta subunit
MSNVPFLQAFEELLEDQIDTINFEKINRIYAIKENRKDEIIRSLKSLPETLETPAGAIKVHKLLWELRDLNSDLEGINFDIGIKRGFSLAVKFIFHNLYS